MREVLLNPDSRAEPQGSHMGHIQGIGYPLGNNCSDNRMNSFKESGFGSLFLFLVDALRYIGQQNSQNQ